MYDFDEIIPRRSSHSNHIFGLCIPKKLKDHNMNN